METDNAGFPSPFLDPAVKATAEYAFQYCQTADSIDRRGMGSNIFRGRNDSYEVLRSYARGNQSIEKYKPILGIKQKTKQNPNPLNYKVLSWEVLAIAPKFVNLLVGKLIGQDNSIGVRAVDQQAQDERRKKKIDLQEFIINRDFLDSVSKATGIGFEGGTGQDGVPAPENHDEVDLYMDMFYKERYCLILQDMLKLLNEQDNYEAILTECATDLIEVGICATKTYRVGKRIKRRRCQPERMIASATTSDNFDNCQYIGEYWDLSIGQLKEIAGAQFTEEQYKVIAEQATGQSFTQMSVKDYYEKHYSYPWDNTKVTVLDLTWWSADTEVYLQKVNHIGNTTVYQQSFNWWNDLRGRGVSEDSFNKANENQVSVCNLNNQYQGMWILNTKFVFNHGKSKDMLKNESDLGTCIGPYCIQSLKKDSIIRQLVPVFDNIQINWLQYQHHAAKSRPAGMDIEFSALQDISLEGAGGKKMRPKEVLELYFDTGILLWRRKDIAGMNTNFRPINELDNGLSAACKDHFMNVVNGIDLLRTMIGENDMTDASTPSGETGKEVAKIAVGASRDAQRFIHYAFDQLNMGTQWRTVLNISSMAQNGMAPDYTEALGLEQIGFLAQMSDIGAHQYGTFLIRQASSEQQLRFTQYINQALSASPPTLYPEEAFEIENEPNVYRRVQLLKTYRRRKQQQQAAAEQQGFMAKAQADTQAAQAAEAARRETQAHLYDLMTNFEKEKVNMEVFKHQKTVGDEAFLLNLKSKLDTNQKLTLEESKRLTELANTRLEGEYMLKGKALEPKTPAKK